MARRTGKIDIVVDSWHRDPRIERRIAESNRDQIVFGLVLVGAIMILVAILW